MNKQLLAARKERSLEQYEHITLPMSVQLKGGDSKKGSLNFSFSHSFWR
jgi:hypothetical protein